MPEISNVNNIFIDALTFLVRVSKKGESSRIYGTEKLAEVFEIGREERRGGSV